MVNKLSQSIIDFNKRDKKNIKTIKIGDKVISPDAEGQAILSGISGGSDNTGGDNPDHPTAGADYYAGSLADGEITERYLLYQRDESVAEQTGSQTVTLLRDVGTKFNMAGDGATFLIHLQKTAMTKGAKGAVTDIELNYDPNNVAKDGYFTTTSPYPIYIKASDLATKKTLAIPINGIGENLSGKNVKAPQLNILFNGDGTMTFESVTGYDNDGDSAGATGANYEVVVDVIATFSVQAAVQQLPPSINLFTGSTSGDIALSGISDFYENSMDGLEIIMDNYIYLKDRIGKPIYRVQTSEITESPVINISKQKLINGLINNADITVKVKPFNPEDDRQILKTIEIDNSNTENSNWQEAAVYYAFGQFDNLKVKISQNSISVEIKPLLKKKEGSGWQDSYWSWDVVKVTPYKN